MSRERPDALLELLARIAVALEQAAEHGHGDLEERTISVLERQVAAYEEHVQWHRHQGFPSPEPRQ